LGLLLLPLLLPQMLLHLLLRPALVHLVPVVAMVQVLNFRVVILHAPLDCYRRHSKVKLPLHPLNFLEGCVRVRLRACHERQASRAVVVWVLAGAAVAPTSSRTSSVDAIQLGNY
jgi:hypothetical protein